MPIPEIDKLLRKERIKRVSKEIQRILDKENLLLIAALVYSEQGITPVLKLLEKPMNEETNQADVSQETQSEQTPVEASTPEAPAELPTAEPTPQEQAEPETEE